MKKLIALYLCCALLSIPLASAVQTSPDAAPTPKKVSSYTVNEYELLKSLSTESNDTLHQMGYTVNQISKIKNLRSAYADHLEEISHYDRAALKNLGYTDIQIDTLQNFDGSESQIMALAATLNFDLSIDYVTWSAADNRTNARLCYEYEWNGIPLIKINDAVAVSWNDWTINGKISYITYVQVNGSGNSQLQAATYVANNGSAAMGGGFRFPMLINNSSHWAKSGYGIFTLYYNNYRKDLSAYAVYTHYTVSATPSFSIPGYGSISFNKSIDYLAEAWVDMACSN